MRNVYCVFFVEGANLLLSSVHLTEKSVEKEKEQLESRCNASEFVIQSWLVNNEEENINE